jgi:chloride channel 3/4/5
MWQSFVCAMVAAVTLQAYNPFRTDKLVMYQVTYHTGWHGFEMVPFAFLGVLGGLYGGFFIKLNMKVAEWRRSRKYLQNPVLEVTLVALITSVVNFPIKFMRAQASELVYTLFAECVDIVDDQLDLCLSGRANTSVITLLILAAILGFFLAAFTFGLLIPAGIILPSMAIGALYGRAVGLTVELWQAAHPGWFIFRSCEPDAQCITPGTYAIIGAASALGGATRMTVSIVVIMFELTGALTYVLPIMIAVMISKWVGDAISPRGIYESWIQFNGYPYLENRDDNAASVPDVPTSLIMTRIEDLMVITATGHTIQSLKDLLAAHPFRGFPVIDNPRDALLLGYISRTELTFALQSALTNRSLPADTEAYFIHQPLADPTTTLDLRPWMDQTPISLNANCGFGLTVNMFQKLGLRYVVFTERGTLRGLLTKKDVWLVLNGRQVEDIGSREALLVEDNAAEESGRVEGATGGLLDVDDLDDSGED